MSMHREMAAEDKAMRKQLAAGLEASGEPNLLAPWAWSSSLQNCEKILLLFKPPSQYLFVMAALRKLAHYLNTLLPLLAWAHWTFSWVHDCLH